MERTFECTDLQENPVVITYKTVLSAYDQEKIDSVFMNNMRYNPDTGKADIDWSLGSLPVLRQNAIVENVVKSWSLDTAPTPDNIKKSLTAKTYARLVETLEAVVAEGDIDEAKKKSSPEN
jgi:hypothetical protein